MKRTNFPLVGSEATRAHPTFWADGIHGCGYVDAWRCFLWRGGWFRMDTNYENGRNNLKFTQKLNTKKHSKAPSGLQPWVLGCNKLIWKTDKKEHPDEQGFFKWTFMDANFHPAICVCFCVDIGTWTPKTWFILARNYSQKSVTVAQQCGTLSFPLRFNLNYTTFSILYHVFTIFNLSRDVLLLQQKTWDLHKEIHSHDYFCRVTRMTLAWIRELAPVIIHVNLPSIAENLACLGKY